MSDRPWNDAESVKGLISQSAALRDPTDSAAGVGDVTVEFGVAPARAWELDARMIRSSVALDGDGVYELSVRLPQTGDGMDDYNARQTLETALEEAIAYSTFPDTGFGQIRGGSQGWNPHAVWSGKPRTRYYEYDDYDDHRLNARQSVRMVENVVREYRKEVDARR